MWLDVGSDQQIAEAIELQSTANAGFSALALRRALLFSPILALAHDTAPSASSVCATDSSVQVGEYYLSAGCLASGRQSYSKHVHIFFVFYQYLIDLLTEIRTTFRACSCYPYKQWQPGIEETI